MNTNLNLYILIAYFAIVIFIGIYSTHKSNKEIFLIAGRNLSFWNLIATISAGLLGGGVLISFTAFVFEYGLAAIWFIVGISLGLVFFLVFYKKIKDLSDSNRFYTISDYFRLKFGARVGYLSAFVIFVWAFFLILMQFIAGGKVLESISGYSYELSVLIMGGVVLIYLILGGFNSVVKTDYFQYLIIVVVGIFIALRISDGISFTQSQFDLGDMGLSQSIAFVIIGGFNIIVSADIWQRIFAAKSKRSAKIGLIGSAFIILIMGIVLSCIGLVTKVVFPDILPDDALTNGMSHLLPSGIFGIGLVLLFAVIMSTLDTMIFITSMNISQDIISHKRKLSKEQLVTLTRYSIIGLIIAGTLIALFVQNIISVGLALSGVGFSLIPSILGSFWFKLKEKAVFISIISGLITIILVLVVGIIGPETSVVSLPVALIFLIIGQKMIWKN